MSTREISAAGSPPPKGSSALRFGRRNAVAGIGACLAFCLGLPAFAAPGVLDLAGPWRSAIGDDPAWAAAELDDSRWTPSFLPATWTELGYGTVTGTLWFRHRLRMPPNWQRDLAPSGLALGVGEAAYGSYEVFAGGERIGNYGGAELRLPVPATRVFRIPDSAVGATGDLVLALRYRRSPWTPARYAKSRGPVGGTIELGDLATLRARALEERLQDRDDGWPMVVLAVLLAAVALYHLLLYKRRRESLEYLWFAVSVFDFLLIVFADQWMGEWTASHAAIRRTLDFATHLALPLVIQFCWSFLGRPIRRPLRAYQASHVLLAVFVALIPWIGWVFATQTSRWWWSLPGWALVALTLAAELRRGDLETRIIGAGGLLISLAGLAESASQVAGRGSTAPLPIWGAAAFATAMTVALAVRFQRIRKELDEMRLQLEEMVADRSQELEIANQKLESEIVEKGLAEEALRMLERGVEQSIDGIVVTDLDDKIEFVNEAWARMHGHEGFELVGRDLSLFHSPEQRQRELGRCLAQAWETGSFEGEIGHVRKDGTPFPTWMSVTRVEDPEHGPVGLVAVGRDITERKKAEAEQAVIESKLRRARKLESLGGLAGGIANDYNNALTGVLSNAALLARGVDPEHPVVDKIRHIEDAAERARDLTDQLLAYAGENAIVGRKVAINDFIAEIEDDLRLRVGDRTRLKIELGEDLPPVEADPEQLHRALRNLVDNAREALGDGPGEVTVRTRPVDADRVYLRGAELNESPQSGRFAAIEIADDGDGIPHAARSRIFDPFYSTRPSARGLGLATVFGIVRAHRGAIKVRSRPGEGTVFELLFPASSSRERDVSPRPESWAELDGSGTVLVVDDEALMREVSESILSESGFQVLTAADGPEALELLRRDREWIRLVLLDNKMPVMDGREVLAAIRRLEPGMRVILMSGFQRKDVLRSFADDHVSGFLQKPFRPEDLLGAVREVLEAG